MWKKAEFVQCIDKWLAGAGVGCWKDTVYRYKHATSRWIPSVKDKMSF